MVNYMDRLLLGILLLQSQEIISLEELLMISLLSILQTPMDQLSLHLILSSTPIPIRISIISMSTIILLLKGQLHLLLVKAITFKPITLTTVVLDPLEFQCKFPIKIKLFTGKPMPSKNLLSATPMIHKS